MEETLSSEKVAMIGGTGFLGSNLVMELLKGHNRVSPEMIQQVSQKSMTRWRL